MSNAIDYHIWLKAKLTTLIENDRKRASEALAVGDKARADLYSGFAMQTATTLNYVENYDVASFNHDKKKPVSL